MAALTPQDHASAWRLIMLIAAGIGAFVYIFATIRRQRRENQNPPSSEPHTIKLWKVEFPELKHLPESERERLLRSALQNPEVEKFRNRTRNVFGIIFYTTMAILLTTVVTSDVPAWLLTIISVPVLLVIMIATVFIRTQLELKIIRRLLKEMLH
jgi:Flp pilus assembly protein TadB